jgi:hypothetical protein
VAVMFPTVQVSYRVQGRSLRMKGVTYQALRNRIWARQTDP